MTELDVQPVDELTFDSPKYVLYGGKGGVGKTTMAAATGVANAAAGTQTLVVSTDPAHSLSDIFDTTIGETPTRIRDSIPLFAVEINPNQSLDEFDALETDALFTDMGGLDEMMGDDVGLDGLVPGADELTAMFQLLEFMEDERFEQIIIDTAPTGHTLRLLELPEMMESMMGQLLTLKERISGFVDGVTGMFGDEETEQASPEMTLSELQDQISDLRHILRDPSKTDFRIVMVPEKLSVFESRRLIRRLRDYQIPVDTVVVNRVLEPVDAIIDGDAEFVSPDLDSCPFCRQRWNVQQDALAEVNELFRVNSIKRVPLFAQGVTDESMIEIVARCLAD